MRARFSCVAKEDALNTGPCWLPAQFTTEKNPTAHVWNSSDAFYWHRDFLFLLISLSLSCWMFRAHVLASLMRAEDSRFLWFPYLFYSQNGRLAVSSPPSSLFDPTLCQMHLSPFFLTNLMHQTRSSFVPLSHLFPKFGSHTLAVLINPH